MNGARKRWPCGSPERAGRVLMSVNSKRVFYVKYLANPIYIDILKARPDVRLDRIENESPEDIFAPILTRRMPTRSAPPATNWRRISMSMPTFLKRTPNLLLVSSNGAGFDPVDVEACTDGGRAGRQPVRRQRAFGRRACAGDDADAVEAHHRVRSHAAPRAQRQPQRARSATRSRTRPSASSASAMSAAASPRCARACSA